MSTTDDAANVQSRHFQYAELFLASLLSLYFEILVVRWLAAEVRLFSYFKNLTLMAAFMGLGIGFALAKRRADYRGWFFLLLVLYVPIVLAMSQVTGYRPVIVPEGNEFIWRVAALPIVVSTVIFGLILIAFFVLTLLLFLPLGQLTGGLMVGLPPLRAYLVNLVGSLVGIWLYSAQAYFSLPPWVWFAVGLLIYLWFSRISWQALLKGGVSTAIVVVAVAIMQRETLWSPYYRLDVFPLSIDGKAVSNPGETGYELYVNQVSHMNAVNISARYVESHPEYAKELSIYEQMYDLPYELVRPQKVLIVGAGMGNDVAAALRHEVQQVDAVEIDPMIHQLGRRLHPEQPYRSPNVRVIIDDARSYLEKTEQSYDAIVFGILDSQTLLSGMSSVRLDNYVYTVESFEKAKAHLAPNGVLVITFDAERWWIAQRLADTLAKVFGVPPIQISVTGTYWRVYISGSTATAADVAALCRRTGCTVEPSAIHGQVSLATDDWPYLYLEQRSIPTPYWVALLVVIAVGWVSTRRAFPDTRGINWHFFLLGSAFMLIEFRIITELALLFGSTWMVNSIAISAVLLMVLLANVMVSNLKSININFLYLLLLLALVAGYFIPLRLLLPYNFTARLGLAVLLMGLPVFLQSAIFATSLRRAQDVTGVFSSNFFGSTIGGVLEYASLAFGIGSLYLIGLGLYAASWFANRRQ